MARGTKRYGFNIDNIVKTKVEPEAAVSVKAKPVVKSTTQETTPTAAERVLKKPTVNQVIKKKEPSKPERPAIIETAATHREKRYQKLIYLNKSQKDTLDRYAKRIGKANGGASRIISDALDDYFDRHSLE